MEVALAGLVGAGLTLVFESVEGAVPDGAVENGLQLIRFIAAERSEAGAALTQSVVVDIWQGWKEARLPHDVALHHIRALPALMDRFRSSDDNMLVGIANARSTSLGDAVAAPVRQAEQVATAIIGRARQSGFLLEHGLDDVVTLFFLDRLLVRLLSDETLLDELRPLLRDYLEAGLWHVGGTVLEGAELDVGVGEDIHDAEVTAEEVEPDASRAEARTIAPALENQPRAATPPPLPASIRAPIDIDSIAHATEVPPAALRHLADCAAARLGPLGQAWLEHMARQLKDILRQLASPAPSDPDAIALKRQAGRFLAVGDTAAADAHLGRAEDIYLRAATLDLAAAHGCLAEAAEARALRARIEELGGHFRRAARHYASAARCLPDSSRRERRELLMRQAGALAAYGKSSNEAAPLSEAAQVYAEAGRLLSVHEAPRDWAMAHLDLGRSLMELGNREGRPERFMAAGRHFKSAANVFLQLDHSESWSHSQLGLADALKAHGEVQGDIAALSEAAFAYRAVLDVVKQSDRPDDWAGASFRLAASLVRLDQETGKITHHNEAIGALRAVVSAPVTATSAPLLSGATVMLVQALLTLAKARGEAWFEEEAINVLRAGQAEVMPRLNPPMRAGLADQLGTILYAIASRRGHPGLVSEAAEMKLAALDHYESNAHDAQASRLRGELDEMENAVIQLTGPMAQGATAS